MVKPVKSICKTSVFRREVDVNWAPLGYYAACSGHSLPTFRDNLLVQFSKVKNPRRFLTKNPRRFFTFADGTDKLSRNVGKYHYTLRNSPEDRSSRIYLQFPPKL